MRRLGGVGWSIGCKKYEQVCRGLEYKRRRSTLSVQHGVEHGEGVSGVSSILLAGWRRRARHIDLLRIYIAWWERLLLLLMLLIEQYYSGSICPWPLRPTP